MIASCDSFAVKAVRRYLSNMQGRLFIGAIAVLLGSTGAMAAEQIKRQPCPKTEQQQQRQQQAQQRERAKPQGCPVQRNIPPAVDPTPNFLL